MSRYIALTVFMVKYIENIHSWLKFPKLKFQLKERGYNNVDAIDGSEGMLEKAKEKGVYKNCITAMLGRTSIKGINRGVQGRIHDFSQECALSPEGALNPYVV